MTMEGKTGGNEAKWKKEKKPQERKEEWTQGMREQRRKREGNKRRAIKGKAE